VLVIIFTCYQLLQIIALPILFIFIILLGWKGKIGSLKQRFGFVPRTTKKHVIWIHAVSVGEVLSIEYFIKKIKHEQPDSICYLTVGTISGKKIAEKNLHIDYLSFLPYDFLPCMLLAYSRIRPQSLIIVEAEQWPNLLILARWKNIPLFSLNARINAQSLNRHMPVKVIFKFLTNCFTKIYAQSSGDKRLFEDVGIKPEKITVLGNIKTFNVIEKKQYINNHNLIKPNSKAITLLVGSLHPGEADIYLDLFNTLKKQIPELKMILAPRHFHWTKELIDTLNTRTISYFLWTETQNMLHFQHEKYEKALDRVFSNNDVLLVCKLGELFKLYPYSNIFFLGGTFVPIGGHNLLEPAVWSVPTIIGPHYHNCKDIADRLEMVDGIIKVSDELELLDQTKILINNAVLRQSIGQHSFDWLTQEAQSVENMLDNLIQSLR